jgi:hypothetical protein
MTCCGSLSGLLGSKTPPLDYIVPLILMLSPVFRKKHLPKGGVILLSEKMLHEKA